MASFGAPDVAATRLQSLRRYQRRPRNSDHGSSTEASCGCLPRTGEAAVLGGSPQFRKFGARVVYAAAGLRAWSR